MKKYVKLKEAEYLILPELEIKSVFPDSGYELGLSEKLLNKLAKLAYSKETAVREIDHLKGLFIPDSEMSFKESMELRARWNKASEDNEDLSKVYQNMLPSMVKDVFKPGSVLRAEGNYYRYLVLQAHGKYWFLYNLGCSSLECTEICPENISIADDDYIFSLKGENYLLDDFYDISKVMKFIAEDFYWYTRNTVMCRGLKEQFDKHCSCVTPDSLTTNFENLVSEKEDVERYQDCVRKRKLACENLLTAYFNVHDYPGEYMIPLEYD